ncbi:uncharacterized protein LOC100905636 [Galendromus occidentalis]|uniref:Uncharacterized protein LOC100905636 n=1 Tax=Galendromus occidentalis TaxID=34638 RepID=A0AAJ7SGY8_9ACAR|nr:uncharacterized protein LOC100905636 [Galendromus occidentalis]
MTQNENPTTSVGDQVEISCRFGERVIVDRGLLRNASELDVDAPAKLIVTNQPFYAVYSVTRMLTGGQRIQLTVDNVIDFWSTAKTLRLRPLVEKLENFVAEHLNEIARVKNEMLKIDDQFLQRLLEKRRSQCVPRILYRWWRADIKNRQLGFVKLVSKFVQQNGDETLSASSEESNVLKKTEVLKKQPASTFPDIPAKNQEKIPSLVDPALEPCPTPAVTRSSILDQPVPEDCGLAEPVIATAAESVAAADTKPISEAEPAREMSSPIEIADVNALPFKLITVEPIPAVSAGDDKPPREPAGKPSAPEGGKTPDVAKPQFLGPGSGRIGSAKLPAAETLSRRNGIVTAAPKASAVDKTVFEKPIFAHRAKSAIKSVEPLAPKSEPPFHPNKVILLENKIYGFRGNSVKPLVSIGRDIPRRNPTIVCNPLSRFYAEIDCHGVYRTFLNNIETSMKSQRVRAIMTQLDDNEPLLWMSDGSFQAIFAKKLAPCPNEIPDSSPLKNLPSPPHEGWLARMYLGADCALLYYHCWGLYVRRRNEATWRLCCEELFIEYLTPIGRSNTFFVLARQGSSFVLYRTSDLYQSAETTFAAETVVERWDPFARCDVVHAASSGVNVVLKISNWKTSVEYFERLNISNLNVVSLLTAS